MTVQYGQPILHDQLSHILEGMKDALAKLEANQGGPRAPAPFFFHLRVHSDRTGQDWYMPFLRDSPFTTNAMSALVLEALYADDYTRGRNALITKWQLWVGELGERTFKLMHGSLDEQWR